MVFTNLEFLVF